MSQSLEPAVYTYGLGLALLLYFLNIHMFRPKKNLCFKLFHSLGCIESKTKTNCERKSALISLNPPIILVCSFKCEAGVPLSDCGIPDCWRPSSWSAAAPPPYCRGPWCPAPGPSAPRWPATGSSPRTPAAPPPENFGENTKTTLFLQLVVRKHLVLHHVLWSEDAGVSLVVLGQELPERTNIKQRPRLKLCWRWKIQTTLMLGHPLSSEGFGGFW